MTIDEQIEILKAYKEGKTIQLQNLFEDWIDIENETHEFNFREYFYRIKPEPKTRRMTFRELAKWLAQGNGEVLLKYERLVVEDAVYTRIWYKNGEENDPVSDEIVIRSWNETEWHEPVIEVEE